MSLEDIKKSIEEETGIILYFWCKECSVCHVLKPKLFDSFEKNFPKIKKISVDIGENSEYSAAFGVFSVPTAIIFLGGKEFARVSRNVSIKALIEKIKRPYGVLTSKK